MKSNKQRYYITLCAIVKDEDPYLREWVLFHQAAGVDHFLIIENAESTSIHDTLQEFVESGLVEVKLYPGSKKPQRETYNRALRYLEESSRWVGFFDVDEFVYPTKDQNLPQVLRKFESFAGLAVNWVSYGSSGHKQRPSGWVTDNYLQRGPMDHVVEHPNYLLKEDEGGQSFYRPMNTHVKCFVDPRRTTSFRTAHHFKYLRGEHAVTETGAKIEGPFSDVVSVSQIRCNHYWSKSMAELDEKLAKGRVSQAGSADKKSYSRELAHNREAASNGVHDDSALRFSRIADENQHPVGGDVPFSYQPRRLRYSFDEWLKASSTSALSGFRRKIKVLLGNR